MAIGRQFGVTEKLANSACLLITPEGGSVGMAWFPAPSGGLEVVLLTL